MLFEFRLRDFFVLQTFSEILSTSTSVLDSIPLAVEVSESRSFSSNFVRLALVVFWPSASLAGLMSLID